MKKVVGYIAVAAIAISVLVVSKNTTMAGMIGLIGLVIISDSND